MNKETGKHLAKIVAVKDKLMEITLDLAKIVGSSKQGGE
jgi:hypothetical protein